MLSALLFVVFQLSHLPGQKMCELSSYSYAFQTEEMWKFYFEQVREEVLKLPSTTLLHPKQLSKYSINHFKLHNSFRLFNDGFLNSAYY